MRAHRRCPRRSSWPGRPIAGAPADAGQATVELVLVLPFVALLALAVVQVGVVVHDQVLLVGAAREAARAAAVSADPASPHGAAGAGGGLATDRLRVTVQPAGDLVEATAAYRSRTDVPLVGALVPDIDLTAAAVMRRER